MKIMSGSLWNFYISDMCRKGEKGMWKKICKNEERIYFWLKVFMLSFMAVFAFVNADVQSFWADELLSIGFVRDGISLKEMMHTYLFVESNLPLYSFLLYFVYRIAPYGEQFLLIPSIIFCIGGIIVLSKLGEILSGKRGSLLITCLGCASNVLIWQGAWEARCYSLLFFLSALTLLTFVKKLMEPAKKNRILYGIALSLFLWTHWFACILAVFYGLVDIILILKKKQPVRNLISYIFGGIIFLPWFIISFVSKNDEFNSFWGTVPTWKNPVWTVLFYLSGRRTLWYVCLLTGIWICICFGYHLFFKNLRDSALIHIKAIAVAAIVWVIGIIFIYSRYINPEGSLYIERYFMVVAPHILVVTMLGFDYILTYSKKIIDYFGTGNIVGKCILATIRLITVFILCYYLVLCYKEEYIAIRKPFQPFREAADFLINDQKIWDEDTALVGSNKFCTLDGFINYYFERRGYEAPDNVIDGAVHRKEESIFYKNYAQYSQEDLKKYKYIYCLTIHMGYDDEFQKFLSQYYTMVQDADENGIEIWSNAVDKRDSKADK